MRKGPNFKLKYISELEQIEIKTSPLGVTNDLPEMPITWPKKHLNAMSQRTLTKWGVCFIYVLLNMLT